MLKAAFQGAAFVLGVLVFASARNLPSEVNMAAGMVYSGIGFFFGDAAQDRQVRKDGLSPFFSVIAAFCAGLAFGLIKKA